MDLNTIWFFLLGILLTGYAILDGFDLGVGILHPFLREDSDRRVLLNSIGPFWDGNEVWLVTFGGAMFAAFPEVYATVFSGFYTAFMLLLYALIFRAISLELRSKVDNPMWQVFWDYAFAAGSTVATLLFGVAVGNAMLGIPVKEVNGAVEFVGTFWGLLGPYQLLVGLFVVATFALHGNLYLCLKTDGALQAKVRTWTARTFAVFVILYVLATVYTLFGVGHALDNLKAYPIAWAVAAVSVLAIVNIPRSLAKNQFLAAFLSSSAAIAAFNLLLGITLWPNLVVSSIDPAFNLDMYNAASSAKTLQVMLIIAGIGMPFVLAYTSVIYWVFRGKVQADKLMY
ncbi:MAG TPA: cytochrome d ubiquinol oxidase subunit II [Candidatus Hydrogenedentes bacterium]|nr:cytochrome d ubiquinol oxidase subunit II [Candidatus Hydrogenedentota bacterium]HQE84003.1 cytochrome d ubiquinol oxidase subunit II [Candidatus Hydrogenedentota bacterium]HQH51802.1 cytochrome d ubiquinol oxidase subunit II [Candidatus Hydrogenedentota bacterium]HQM48389.1 cytochrome d ubiquinol oxidase subunit II [Candidatus Hydrogenedentota bacterium]